LTGAQDRDYCFDIAIFGQVSKDVLHASCGTIHRLGGVTYPACVAARLGLTTWTLSYASRELVDQATTRFLEAGISPLWVVYEGDSITYDIHYADEIVEQQAVRGGPLSLPNIVLPDNLSSFSAKACLVYPVSHSGAVEFMREFGKHCGIMSIDLQHDIIRPEDLEQFRPYIDLVFTNRSSLMALYDDLPLLEAIKELQKSYPNTYIVVKMGLSGSLAVDRTGEIWQVPAYTASFAFTVGAGDAFDIAVLTQLIRGSELRHAVDHGSRLAARFVESTSERPEDSISNYNTDARKAVGVSISKPTPLIYVAGHFHSEPIRMYMEHVGDALENVGFETFLPHRDAGIVGLNDVTPAHAFRADICALRDAVGIIAVLDGAYRGGTYFELGFAYCNGKPAFILCTDNTLGVSNMISQSSRVVTSDLITIVNEILEHCGNVGELWPAQ